MENKFDILHEKILDVKIAILEQMQSSIEFQQKKGYPFKSQEILEFSTAITNLESCFCDSDFDVEDLPVE